MFLAARAETLFFDNVPVDKIGMKNERITNLEYLGNDMIEAGNEFGVATPYGAALVRVGQAEQKYCPGPGGWAGLSFVFQVGAHREGIYSDWK